MDRKLAAQRAEHEAQLAAQQSVHEEALRTHELHIQVETKRQLSELERNLAAVAEQHLDYVVDSVVRVKEVLIRCCPIFFEFSCKEGLVYKSIFFI